MISKQVPGSSSSKWWWVYDDAYSKSSLDKIHCVVTGLNGINYMKTISGFRSLTLPSFWYLLLQIHPQQSHSSLSLHHQMWCYSCSPAKEEIIMSTSDICLFQLYFCNYLNAPGNNKSTSEIYVAFFYNQISLIFHNKINSIAKEGNVKRMHGPPS